MNISELKRPREENFQTPNKFSAQEDKGTPVKCTPLSERYEILEALKLKAQGDRHAQKFIDVSFGDLSNHFQEYIKEIKTQERLKSKQLDDMTRERDQLLADREKARSAQSSMQIRYKGEVKLREESEKNMKDQKDAALAKLDETLKSEIKTYHDMITYLQGKDKTLYKTIHAECERKRLTILALAGKLKSYVVLDWRRTRQTQFLYKRHECDVKNFNIDAEEKIEQADHEKYYMDMLAKMRADAQKTHPDCEIVVLCRTGKPGNNCSEIAKFLQQSGVLIVSIDDMHTSWAARPGNMYKWWLDEIQTKLKSLESNPGNVIRQLFSTKSRPHSEMNFRTTPWFDIPVSDVAQILRDFIPNNIAQDKKNIVMF